MDLNLDLEVEDIIKEEVNIHSNYSLTLFLMRYIPMYAKQLNFLGSHDLSISEDEELVGDGGEGGGFDSGGGDGGCDSGGGGGGCDSGGGGGCDSGGGGGGCDSGGDGGD